MAEFGSSDSGASLGDILGAALSRAQKKDDDGRRREVRPPATGLRRRRPDPQGPGLFSLAFKEALGFARSAFGHFPFDSMA